ncbi:MAG: hypothetical protein R3D58_14790 [Saprospiraceae bacterium]
MKFFFTLIILASISIGESSGQKDAAVQQFEANVIEKMNDFLSYCPVSEELARKAWDDLRDVKDEIETHKNKGGHGKETYQNLISLVSICETLDDYMICIGDWNRFPIRSTRLNQGAVMMQAQTAYLFTGKFCVNVIELNMGSYRCLLAENKGTASVNVKYNFGSDSGNYNGEMGLAAGHVRVMVNNRDCDAYESLFVRSIECTSF